MAGGLWEVRSEKWVGSSSHHKEYVLILSITALGDSELISFKQQSDMI